MPVVEFVHANMVQVDYDNAVMTLSNLLRPPHHINFLCMLQNVFFQEQYNYTQVSTNLENIENLENQGILKIGIISRNIAVLYENLKKSGKM